MSLATASPTTHARGPARPTDTVPGEGPSLPRWPVTACFGAYAVWWVLGILDTVVLPLSVVMLLYLFRTRGVRVPRGFGVWLFFLLWAAASFIMVRGIDSTLGFSYRYLQYTSATVVFVYVYNARRQLTARYVLGLLTSVWLLVVLGGYLGVVYPTGVIKTPMAYLVEGVKSLIPSSASLLNNELIRFMVVRRFSQFNEGSFFNLAPRPAAPFQYTNNWGNVYSLLLPLVVAYTLHSRGLRRTLLWIALPVSAVPALLTLNRGMLIGVVLTMAYASWRLLLMGRPRVLAWIGVAAVVGAVLFSVLPVQERLDARLSFRGSSTETRASIYQQALESVPESPFLGYGAPLEGDPNGPPVGTQGQVWMTLVSHGPVALAASMGWLLLVVVQSRRRDDLFGLAAHISVLVGTVELLYYGVLPYGLPLMMVAAALALRPADDDPSIPRLRAVKRQPTSRYAQSRSPLN